MPFDSPPPDALLIQVVTTVCETFAYAIFLVLFIVMSYLRLSPAMAGRRKGLAAWCGFVEVSTLSLVLLATAHWAVGTGVMFYAFFNGTAPNTTLNQILFDRYLGPMKPYLSVGHSLAFVSILIGDLVIIHRLWTIYNRSFRVVLLPVTMLPASISFSWQTAHWVLSSLITIYCTTLIARKIWFSVRRQEEAQTRMFFLVMIILCESAALWLVWTIFFLSAHLSGSDVRVINNALVPSVIGIANVLIYLRIALAGLRVSSRPGSPTAGRTTRKRAGTTGGDNSESHRVQGTLTNPASFAMASMSGSGTDSEWHGGAYGYGAYEPRDSFSGSGKRWYPGSLGSDDGTNVGHLGLTNALDADRKRAEYGEEYIVEVPQASLHYNRSLRKPPK
ncbi:hypothetical protein MKEN_00301600 [Mycena kentingensis (nom. inval.)]|nr:hypothetical protein MKEN_00301600 [Mycena kentingensis (nom. inval.)]